MQKTLIFLFTIMTFLSCEKDDDQVIERNSIAEDLQLVIMQEGVQALQSCCKDCDCIQPNGFGRDYSFTGDNFVRIRDKYYNLNQLISYEITTETQNDPPETEIRMVLTFP